MKRVLREVVVGAVTSAAAVGAGALVVAAPAAWAQDSQPSTPASTPQVEPQQAPVAAIRRLVIEGNQRVETSTINSYLLVRPGDAFDPERIDLSLKTLFSTGLFADVKIIARDADLIVTVVENPVINRVLFEGVNNLKKEDLEKEVQAKARGVFTPARAQSDVQRLIELYRRSGRFAAQVSPQVVELEQNRVDLIFEVDEGPVTGVRNINFIGNKAAFSDDDLRQAVLTEESKWWRFFSRNDNYDPDRLEYDRELLRQYYTNRGYADFRIVSAVAELTPDQKDFFITFTVDEGEKYDFGEVTVETELDGVHAELLKAVIPIQSGKRFEGELIEKSIDAMTFTAGTAGYANVDIRPRVERDKETRKVNLTFEVDEGPRVFVDRIEIVGNSRTLDQVIRRELRVAEGDAFNRVLLDRSRARIRSLGFFKKVEIAEKPGSEPDRSVVEVNVEEDTTGELAFAAGFSSTDSFLLDVSVSERNLRGRGQFLRLRAATSSRRQNVDIQFVEPKFLGRNLSAGFSLFSQRTDFLDESSFENQSTGVGLRYGFPVTDTTNMGVTYTLRNDDTEVANLLTPFDDDNNAATPTTLIDQCSPLNPGRPALCLQEGSFLTSVLGYAFNWDRRNDPISPTRGFTMSLNQDLAGLGGDVNYLRTEFEGAVYRGIFTDVVASFTLNAGYVYGWGGDDVRINDRFFKGGQSFRGFDVAGIGPRQIFLQQNPADPTNVQVINGDSLGGNAFAIGSFQLTFPTGLPKEYGVSAALFAEVGSLGTLDDRDKVKTVFTDGSGNQITAFVDDAFSLRASYGLSIFWDSPFGPVQFDFADPFASEPYDRTEAFRFSTRTRF
jgi:outer membrane protein insertion porin family